MGMISWVMGADSSIIDASKNGGSGPYTSGAVYWDANTNQFNVIDSNGNKTNIPGETININVGPKLREMIVWYETYRIREEQQTRELEKLCEEFPNLKDALGDIEKARKDFKILYNLVKEQK
jgi:hypothetical protein